MPKRTSLTVDSLLADSRAQLERLTPREAHSAVSSGAILVDIRPTDQRERDGAIPGAAVVARNVLEWRLDPSSGHGDPALAHRDCPVILICDEGYQSSLAAATLRAFGLDATDVIGGAQAWADADRPLGPAN